MSDWFAFDDGRNIGTVSSEGGVILRDDQHLQGARITLKRGASYVSVSCSIYGWMDHTRFFSSVPEAEREFNSMKSALEKFLTVFASSTLNELMAWEAISNFVARFP
jgi:hypothetical protein